MEKFSFPEKQERRQKNNELFKSLEGYAVRVQRALKLLAYSAIINLSMAKNIEAQESLPPPIKNVKIEWRANISDQEKDQIEKTVSLEREWLVDYTKSPKFKERITKEYIRTDNFKNQDGTLRYDDFVKNYPCVTSKDDSDALEKSLPNPNIENISKQNNRSIEKIIKMRLSKITRGKTIVVDSFIESNRIIGKFVSGNNEIYLRKDFTKKASDVPVHELTHRSTVNNQDMQVGTLFIIKSRMGKESIDDFYYPTELNADINGLRFLLDQEHIYNPSTEDMDEATYEKMIKNEKIMKSADVKRLLKTLTKEDLIWFMNNIAGIPISTVDFQDMA